MNDQDENKSLEYILEGYINHGQINSYFVKCNGSDCIYFGQLDIEIGPMEELDNHCEQCFNEQISWFRFKGDGKLCDVIGAGVVGLKKFNSFKERNELNKILNGIEIIDVIV